MTSSMNKIAKVLLIIAGIFSTVLGIIGIFLPILPTTPFLLLAAVCFVNSSERFYSWLTGNRFFGSYIENYREGRGIVLRAKVFTLALLWVAIGYSVYRVNILPVRIGLLIVAAAVTVHLLKVPTLKK